MPAIRPKLRMSMTCGQSRRLWTASSKSGASSAARVSRPSRRRSPASRAPRRRPAGGRNRCSRGTARWRPPGPCIRASWTSRLANTAPIGKAPLVRPLAVVMMSGVTPKYSRRKGRAEPAEAGDHLVEDQQDAVLRRRASAAAPGSPSAAAARRSSPPPARRSPRRWSPRHAARPAAPDRRPAPRRAPAGPWRRRSRQVVGVPQVVGAGQQRAEPRRLLTRPPTEMPPKPTP